MPDNEKKRLSLQAAQFGDRDAVRALINEAFAVERFLKKGGGDRLQEDGEFEQLWQRGIFLVAKDGAALAACVYVELRSERAYLGLLSIAPARQGTGLGRRMNTAAEEYAAAHGCKWIDLRVVSPREKQLVPIYRRLGYEVSGTQEYSDELQEKMAHPGHFILMSKSLAAP